MAEAAEHDPRDIARSMYLTRGADQAIDRCEGYISGRIRSENPKEFWEAVLAEVWSLDSGRSSTARAEA